MGTTMASVSFRRTDNMNWSALKPKIKSLYQGIEGIVSNIEQEEIAYAIVSPYGDSAVFLEEITEKVSQLTGDYVIFCMCVDSDYALLKLYCNGQKIEEAALGAPELLEEIDELADLSMPDVVTWKPLLQDEKNAEALYNAFKINEVFVEDQLRIISALTGMPIFNDVLVFEECF